MSIPSQLQQCESRCRSGGEQELRLSLALPSLIFLDLLVAKTPGRVYDNACRVTHEAVLCRGTSVSSHIFAICAGTSPALGCSRTFFHLFLSLFSLLGVFPSLSEQGFSFLMGILNWPRLCGKDAVKRCPV